MRVPVVDQRGVVLMPCTPPKARWLLKAKKALHPPAEAGGFRAEKPMNALQTIRKKLIDRPEWTSPAVALLLELEVVPADRRPAATVARRYEVQEACQEAGTDMAWLARARGVLIDAAPVPARQVPPGF